MTWVMVNLHMLHNSLVNDKELLGADESPTSEIFYAEWAMIQRDFRDSRML